MTDARDLKTEYYKFKTKRYVLKFSKSGFGVLVEVFNSIEEIAHYVAPNKKDAKKLAIALIKKKDL